MSYNCGYNVLSETQERATLDDPESRFSIEACCPDDNNWDSDLVGSESYTLDQARKYLTDLRFRAENDHPDDNHNPDGVSWRDCKFRLVTTDDDDCYCVIVD